MRNKLKRALAPLADIGMALLLFGLVLGFLALVVRDLGKSRTPSGRVAAASSTGASGEGAADMGVAADEQHESTVEGALPLQDKRPPASSESEGLGQRIQVQDQRFTVDVLADGFESPDGLAVHPTQAWLYVGEEAAGRIWMCSDGGRHLAVDADLPILQSDGTRSAVPLQSVEGIDVTEQALFAVEDRPGGRLLQFDLQANGRAVRGSEIAVPGVWDDFAWEDVAVCDDGRLLLVGSNIERVQAERDLSLFVGVLLYRDQHGTWWIPYERMFASFSAVAFSKSGDQAIYTCEVTGEVGWIDLRTPRPIGGASDKAASAPEGLCVLPDGALAVAEEGGSLLTLDPAVDTMHQVADGLGRLESLAWDPHEGRLLAVDDASGRLLALYPVAPFNRDENRMGYAQYRPIRSLVHVPEQCPDYLAGVLALGGLDYRSYKEPPLSFRAFTQRVPAAFSRCGCATLAAEPGCWRPDCAPATCRV